MTKARSQLISLNDTPYYHITGRCVRRAFLCGIDHYSGKNYEHRRQWLIDHLARLADIFCIDISAYAIMSNHYHLVLHVNRDAALALSDHDIAKRWGMLFTIPNAVKDHLSGQGSESDKLLAQAYLSKWRDRLYSISWFMRCFNEHIARKANQEDDCKGHFWESRFKSQALLDEQAVLQCMAYVDLNPIRAKMANTPETSDYTSIQQRMIALGLIRPIEHIDYSVPLQPFAESASKTTQANEILFTTAEYLQLIDWLGRCVRTDKRGAIPLSLAPLFQRLGTNPEAFAKSMKNKRSTASAIGNHQATQRYLERIGQKHIRNRPAWL